MNGKIYAALHKAIDRAGGATEVGVRVAKKIKRRRPYTRQAVEAWYRYRPVPLEIVPALEAVIGLPRGKIRPDYFDGP